MISLLNVGFYTFFMVEFVDRSHDNAAMIDERNLTIYIRAPLLPGEGGSMIKYGLEIQQNGEIILAASALEALPSGSKRLPGLPLIMPRLLHCCHLCFGPCCTSYHHRQKVKRLIAFR